jgi:predicted HAD superfamily Cof-like phosphohydrolase
MVRTFHKRIDAPISPSPRALTGESKSQRIIWMNEELNELLRADEIVEQVDALVDTIYFAIGALVEMGVRPGGMFEIVHEANMRKVGKRSDFSRTPNKATKPLGWVGPEQELKRLIALQSEDK